MHVKLFDFDFEYTVLLQWQDNFCKVHLSLHLSTYNKLDSNLRHNNRTFSVHSGRTFVLRKNDIILIYILCKHFLYLILYFHNCNNPFYRTLCLKANCVTTFSFSSLFKLKISFSNFSIVCLLIEVCWITELLFNGLKRL